MADQKRLCKDMNKNAIWYPDCFLEEKINE